MTTCVGGSAPARLLEDLAQATVGREPHQTEPNGASRGLNFFNKTLCTSGPPAAQALFSLAPNEEGGIEPRPRA